MSARLKPRYDFQSKEEEYAYYRRRDHSNLETVQNLVIAEIARRAAVEYAREHPEVEKEKLPKFEMPPNARHLISAIQGAHGGGQRPFEEFERDYVTIGRQLQFTGTDDAIRSRVRAWLNSLSDWQYAVGFQLIYWKPGGEIIGQREDGTNIYSKTVFIDHLKPPSDEAVQRARLSVQWRGDDKQGVIAHPGLAMEAQIGSVLKALPRLGTRAESGADKSVSGLQPLDQYERQQEEKLKGWVEDRAIKIELRGGDGVHWVRRLASDLRDLADSLEKTAPARNDYASLSALEEAEQASATSNTCKTKEAAQPDSDDLAEALKALRLAPDEEAFDRAVSHASALGASDDEIDAACRSDLGKENLTQENIGVFEDSATEPEPDMLEWALFWASQNIPVFPVWSVSDGICDCRDGSECKSAGKHPLERLAKKGSHSASTDPEVIKKWWEAEPRANIGGVMGGAIRLLAVDVDPRAGGDASFFDLCAAHGEEWASTLRNISGSGGFHLFFVVPEGVEFHRAKLAPGIDLKWHKGYVVLPLSAHVSGRSYSVADLTPALPAPDWLVGELTRKADEQPSVVIDFQERKDRLSAGLSKEKFYESNHERNDGLFSVLIGRWRHGWMAGEGELREQAYEINAARCVPPLDGEEVEKMIVNISRNYTHLRGVDAEGAA